MVLITPGRVCATSEREKNCKTLTWTDLAPSESESEKECRVATVRENVWKMKSFSGQGKVREFCGWPGNLERTWKVREKSGNLKIDSYGNLQKIICSVQKGKGCTFS